MIAPHHFSAQKNLQKLQPIRYIHIYITSIYYVVSNLLTRWMEKVNQTYSYLRWGFYGGEKTNCGIIVESDVTMLWTMYCTWVNKRLVHLKPWWVFKFHVIFSWRPPFSGLSLFAFLEGARVIPQMLFNLWSVLSHLPYSPWQKRYLIHFNSNIILWNKNVVKEEKNGCLPAECSPTKIISATSKISESKSLDFRNSLNSTHVVEWSWWEKRCKNCEPNGDLPNKKHTIEFQSPGVNMTILTHGCRYIHKLESAQITRNSPPKISPQTLLTCGGTKCLLYLLPKIPHHQTLEFPPLVPARETRNPTDAVTPPRKRSTARPQFLEATKVTWMNELYRPIHDCCCKSLWMHYCRMM